MSDSWRKKKSDARGKMKYPSFHSFMNMRHGPTQRLLVIALGKLTVQEPYEHMTPTQVWEVLIEDAKAVYKEEGNGSEL